MTRRYPLLILLTILTLASCIFGSLRAFRPSSLPFTLHVVGAHTAVIQPIPGVLLPPGLHAGDQIELPALNAKTRMAIAIAIASYGQLLPLGHVYDFTFTHAGKSLTVPVTTVDASHADGALSASLSIACLLPLIGLLALLLLWRGREHAAAGMALWTISWVIGVALELAPFDGVIGIAVILIAYLCILLSRVGFYIMIESAVGSVFKLRSLWLWRLAFASDCAITLSWIFLAILWYPLGHSGFWLISAWGSLLAISYLVPLVMLYSGYHSASVALRQRLRWMLWSGSLWVIAAFGSDVLTFEAFSWDLLWTAGFMLSACGFVYAILRHRVIAISLVLDRTLVYGFLTALVVGVLAAVQSVVQHAALGTSASLLLQIIVPLALGIVLGQMRKYADKIVEQLFFRKRYLAEQALRQFARHASGYEDSEELLAAAAMIVGQKTAAPGVTIYQRKNGQYLATHRQGSSGFPESVRIDDPAFAAARSGQKDVDLSGLQSALGSDGYVFAMDQQGMLVCANRPGEHYAADERKLLAYVARRMGVALDKLRMQEAMRRLEAKAGLVDALASGTLPASATLKAKARELVSVSIP